MGGVCVVLHFIMDTVASLASFCYMLRCQERVAVNFLESLHVWCHCTTGCLDEWS
jgi:hypothetical protein